MAKKSRQGKGKHQPQSRKGRAKQRYAAVAAGQQAVSPVTSPSEPVAASIPSPPVSVRTTPAVSGKARYTYITAELKRIGILSGIILAILIVLALVLQ
ncbi:hypothetical protein ACFLXF_00800 [Chloroflexota bacterium]